MKSTELPFLALLVLLLTFSCKPKVPSNYIQPDVLENILYDYHIADAMTDNTGPHIDDNSYNAYLYRQAVLRKYNVTQAEFDSSMVYYMRHADRMYQIYQNLSDRLGSAALALGASANEINHFGDIQADGDTANVWTGKSSYLLMQEAPYNVMSFDIETDTTYHEGDKLILSFKSDFLFKDGAKTATAMLAIQLVGDSVISRSIRISSSSDYTISVIDNDYLGIKAVKGFVYLDKGKKNNRANNDDISFRLMFIDNIRLVRMHAKVEKPEKIVNPDVNDSIPKSDGIDSLKGESRNNDNPDNKKQGEPLKMYQVQPNIN
ncbi:MAG: DUF4296 domain-containing protein [Prevotella sp.]|nr:DUF4296 domain-containing protein [Prevotella sp.]